MIPAQDIEAGQLPAACDPHSPPGSHVTTLIDTYFRHWNAKDAAEIWSRIYRLDPGHRLGSEADLRQMLDATVASGWDHSTLDAITVHPCGPGAWLARIAYTRFSTDGSVLPPANRLGAYVVSEAGDGLRITALPLAGRPIISA